MFSFTTEKPVWFIIFCLLAATSYCIILYKNEKVFSGHSKWLSYSLYLLRFLSVFIITFLLLSPLIKNVIRNVEKPIIVIAQDNTQSLLINKDSNYYKSTYKKDLEVFIKNVQSKYDTKTFLFGDNIIEGSIPNYNNKQTDIAGLFNEINNKFSGRNLGAVVLATDGIYNEGENPYYSLDNINAPIYAMALGDTNVRKDLIIKKVNHNKYAYLGNTFPIEILVEAKQFRGKQATVTISKDGQTLGTQNISISNNAFYQTVSMQLTANQKGLNQYTIQIKPLQDEITLSNNIQDVFIEVLDAQQQILILAAAPHPDIAAIRRSIEKNQNYECEVALAEQFNKPIAKFSLIILHNLPSVVANNKVVSDIIKSEIPLLFIAGTQTNFNAFNALQTGISIFPNNNKFNECQAGYNKGFSLFTCSDKFINTIASFPPLQCSFASYKTTNSCINLFNQKNGSIQTSDPLVTFSNSNLKKIGVICGDGLWRWAIADYQENNNFDVFNEFVGKSIQFLAAVEDKSLFKVNTNNNFFENENIEFNAELYNDSYELINDKDVTLNIINSKGKQFPFVFSTNGNSYKLNAGLFPSGQI